MIHHIYEPISTLKNINNSLKTNGKFIMWVYGYEGNEIYSDKKTQKWVRSGCKEADIGCIECKQPVIDGISKELKRINFLINLLNQI